MGHAGEEKMEVEGHRWSVGSHRLRLGCEVGTVPPSRRSIRDAGGKKTKRDSSHPQADPSQEAKDKKKSACSVRNDEILFGRSQRLRTGLTCDAPLALRRKAPPKVRGGYVGQIHIA